MSTTARARTRLPPPRDVGIAAVACLDKHAADVDKSLGFLVNERPLSGRVRVNVGSILLPLLLALRCRWLASGCVCEARCRGHKPSALAQRHHHRCCMWRRYFVRSQQPSAAPERLSHRASARVSKHAKHRVKMSAVVRVCACDLKRGSLRSSCASQTEAQLHGLQTFR